MDDHGQSYSPTGNVVPRKGLRVEITPALIRRALELQFRYQIDYWDAGILAAAEHARCRVLWSEDLNPGQLYATVHVENPLAVPRKKT